MQLSVRDRLGPYEILARLGEGGISEAWKARDTWRSDWRREYRPKLIYSQESATRVQNTTRDSNNVRRTV
jgi:hypothetical protein